MLTQNGEILACFFTRSQATASEKVLKMKPQELQRNNSMQLRALLALPSHLIHLKHLMHF